MSKKDLTPMDVLVSSKRLLLEDDHDEYTTDNFDDLIVVGADILEMEDVYSCNCLTQELKNRTYCDTDLERAIALVVLMARRTRLGGFPNCSRILKKILNWLKTDSSPHPVLAMILSEALEDIQMSKSLKFDVLTVLHGLMSENTRILQYDNLVLQYMMEAVTKFLATHHQQKFPNHYETAVNLMFHLNYSGVEPADVRLFLSHLVTAICSIDASYLHKEFLASLILTHADKLSSEDQIKLMNDNKNELIYCIEKHVTNLRHKTISGAQVDSSNDKCDASGSMKTLLGWIKQQARDERLQQIASDALQEHDDFSTLCDVQSRLAKLSSLVVQYPLPTLKHCQPKDYSQVMAIQDVLTLEFWSEWMLGSMPDVSEDALLLALIVIQASQIGYVPAATDYDKRRLIDSQA